MASKIRKRIIIVTSIAGIAGCLVDIISMLVLGSESKGYNPFKNTMSALGNASSPVAQQMTFWWILMGILISIFGIGLLFAFGRKKKPAQIAALLIILYGIGEGFGSALFPADVLRTHHTWIGLIHDSLGAIGTTGITFFPLAIRKLMPEFKNVSVAVVGIGIAGIILFGIAQFWPHPHNFFVLNKGLWQRIFVFDYYFFVIAVAIRMLLPSFKNY